MTSAHESTNATTTTTTPSRKVTQRKSTPSEIWDDDFVFQKNDSPSESPRHGKARTSSHMGKDVSQTPSLKRNAIESLREWSESPTSPRHRGVSRIQLEENWDDDFLDNTESPVRPNQSSRRSRLASKASDDADQENWDEELELSANNGENDPNNRIGSPNATRSRRDAAWDSSDDEDAISRLEYGCIRDDEDRTVTSRSRRRPLGSLGSNEVPIPSLPPLPAFPSTISSGDISGLYEPSPFPRSPTHSVFSIPATTTSAGGRDSLNYGSTAHLSLNLRRTHSAESSSPIQQKISSRFPPISSEIPRERRRLRKKSRPPHLDSSILELDDKAASAPETTMFRPETPERPTTPPHIASLATTTPTTPSSAVSPVLPKSPLLLRIGSMKRWGVGPRRKQISIGGAGKAPSPLSTMPPSSILSSSIEADRLDNNRTPRPRSYIAPSSHPPPMLSTPSTPRRFFRGSSGGANEGTPMSSNEDITLLQERAKERERERLRIALPVPMMQPQSSQSGESDFSVSPHKTRIKAFGQKIMASAAASAKSKSPERGSYRSSSRERYHSKVDTHLGLTVSNGGSSTTSSFPLSPLSNDSSSRLRPRISHQIPSNLRDRPIFPRHVSGSAVHDHNHARSLIAPALGSRSVSASTVGTSSDDMNLGENSGGSDNLGGYTKKDKQGKEGHRGFMGSMRRISLGGSHRRHQRNESATADDSDDCRTPAATTSPNIPPHFQAASLVDPYSSSLDTTAQFSPLSDYSKIPTTVPSKVLNAIPPSLATSVDLTSPSSSPPLKDRLPVSRRSGDHPILSHSKSSSFATSSPGRVASPVSRINNSPQAASLGRASPLPNGPNTSPSSVLRRNSLGDLKIPSRISRAQDGLKRDLGRVREFAAHVEQMQELRSSYFTLANQVQIILETPRPPSRATSPTHFFGLSRSSSRARSKTNPPPLPAIDYRNLALSFQAIDNKYRIAWECADLLIELGTGTVPDSNPTPTGPNNSPSEPPRQNRERAVTLAGDEGKPDINEINQKSPVAPALVSWRASTGRQDVGHRQLYLLREMLNNSDSVKEDYRLENTDFLDYEGSWTNDGMSSSLTLPTDESAATNPEITQISPSKKRRRGSILGMIGIRDMLRSLKRNTARAQQAQADNVGSGASAPFSTNSSSFETTNRHFDNHPYNTVSGIPIANVSSRRKSETNASMIQDALRSPSNDYNPYINGITHKSSPRRPSLASLFRIGQKHKTQSTGTTERAERQIGTSSKLTLDDPGSQTPNKDYDSDSDWDRMDSTSDIDAQIEAINSTFSSSVTKLRKKSAQTIQASNQQVLQTTATAQFDSSQTSVTTPDQSLVNVRLPRLSNVDENYASGSGRQTPSTPESHRRPVSRGKERPFSSVRTVPPKPSKGLPSFDAPTDLKLAMTPENIKPLLDNARVVTARLQNCLAEVRGLLIRTEGSAFRASASTSNVALSTTTPSCT